MRDWVSTFAEEEQNNKWRDVPGAASRVGQADGDDVESAGNSGTATPVKTQ